MLEARREELNKARGQMFTTHRYRWCASSLCGCMGAANCSGGLRRLGFTREEWEEWVADNPEPAASCSKGINFSELAQFFVREKPNEN